MNFSDMSWSCLLWPTTHPMHKFCTSAFLSVLTIADQKHCMVYNLAVSVSNVHAFTKQINSYNSPIKSNLPIHIFIHVIQSGNTYIKGTRHKRPSLRSNADDWQLLVYYDHVPVLFPPDIVHTTERPDNIIWYNIAKHVMRC